jgi:hypothetical protein
LEGASSSRSSAARQPPGCSRRRRNPPTGDRSSVISLKQRKRHKRAGLLHFLEGMRDLGYVEGQNVEIAYRFGNFDRARLPALAEELVRLNPHLIFAADPIAERVRRTLENVVAELKLRGRTAEQN